MNDTIQKVIFACEDAQLQDEQDVMSYPHYSLSKNKCITPKTYFGQDSDGSPFKIELSPNVQHGMMTIFDYDLILFCTSHIAQAIKNGQEASKTIIVSRHHVLKSIGRHTGGDNYKDLGAAFSRIQGTLIRNTKLKLVQGRKQGYTQYSFITSLRFVPETEEYEIELCDWIYDSIIDKQLLALSPDYYQIKSPISRRLYLMFRKHAGSQSLGFWMSFSVLYKKSGSEDSERKFKSRIKEFVKKKNNLPEYFLTEETNPKGIEGIRGTRRDFLPFDHPGKMFTLKKRKKILANLS